GTLHGGFDGPLRGLAVAADDALQHGAQLRLALRARGEAALAAVEALVALGREAHALPMHGKAALGGAEPLGERNVARADDVADAAFDAIVEAERLERFVVLEARG